MPQVQILSKEDQPISSQMNDIAKNAQEQIRFRTAMALTITELKQQAKNSDNEAGKARFEREAKIAEYAFKLKEQGVDGPMLIKAVSDFGGQDTFPVLAKTGRRANEFIQTLADAPGSGEREGRLALAEKNKAEANQANRMNSMMNRWESGQGGRIPPGTTMGPNGLTIPLNPSVSVPEADTITKGDSAESVLSPINKAIDSGIFGKDPTMRTMRQLAVENADSLFTSSSPTLQKFQSDYNVIRQLALFDEAGRALTGTEKEEQLRKLNLRGKSDETIKNDLQFLANKAINKRNLIKSGANTQQRGAKTVGRFQVIEE